MPEDKDIPLHQRLTVSDEWAKAFMDSPLTHAVQELKAVCDGFGESFEDAYQRYLDLQRHPGQRVGGSDLVSLVNQVKDEITARAHEKRNLQN